MRHVAAQSFAKIDFVVGVELRVVAATRHRYIGQTPVHEFFARLLGVHVNKHAVGGLTLAAMAGHQAGYQGVLALKQAVAF